MTIALISTDNLVVGSKDKNFMLHQPPGQNPSVSSSREGLDLPTEKEVLEIVRKHRVQASERIDLGSLSVFPQSTFEGWCVTSRRPKHVVSHPVHPPTSRPLLANSTTRQLDNRQDASANLANSTVFLLALSSPVNFFTELKQKKSIQKRKKRKPSQEGRSP